MRPNKLRHAWQAGQAIVNGWLAIPNSFSAETMAHQGWDSLTIDLQHGVVDYQAMVTMLQAISTTETVPVVLPFLDAAQAALIRSEISFPVSPTNRRWSSPPTRYAAPCRFSKIAV